MPNDNPKEAPDQFEEVLDVLIACPYPGTSSMAKKLLAAHKADLEAERRAAKIEALNDLWQRVPAVLGWDSTEAQRASWLKGLIEAELAALQSSKERAA